ncbi:MAG: hypothetical protein ACOX7H_02365 [Bacillota bacterium]|jgi:hypothetical protein
MCDFVRFFRDLIDKIGELTACCLSSKLLIFGVCLLLLLYLMIFPSFIIALALIGLFLWMMLF